MISQVSLFQWIERSRPSTSDLQAELDDFKSFEKRRIRMLDLECGYLNRLAILEHSRMFRFFVSVAFEVKGDSADGLTRIAAGLLRINE